MILITIIIYKIHFLNKKTTNINLRINKLRKKINIK